MFNHKNNTFWRHIGKLYVTLLYTLFALLGFGQNGATDNFSLDFCGCNKTTKTPMDSMLKYDKNGEIRIYYANGNIKYKATKKRWNTHQIYYYPTGIKCKEEFLNFKIHIKKTFFYDTLEKKQMVCKGSLEF